MSQKHKQQEQDEVKPFFFKEHNTKKFQTYIDLTESDKIVGFYLNNKSEKYYFDEDGGWSDYNGCYYNANGEPNGWVILSPHFKHYDLIDMNKQHISTKANFFYSDGTFQPPRQNLKKSQVQTQPKEKYEKVPKQSIQKDLKKEQQHDEDKNDDNEEKESTENRRNNQFSKDKYFKRDNKKKEFKESTKNKRNQQKEQNNGDQSEEEENTTQSPFKKKKQEQDDFFIIDIDGMDDKITSDQLADFISEKSEVSKRCLKSIILTGQQKQLQITQAIAAMKIFKKVNGQLLGEKQLILSI